MATQLVNHDNADAYSGLEFPLRASELRSLRERSGGVAALVENYQQQSLSTIPSNPLPPPSLAPVMEAVPVLLVEHPATREIMIVGEEEVDSAAGAIVGEGRAGGAEASAIEPVAGMLVGTESASGDGIEAVEVNQDGSEIAGGISEEVDDGPTQKGEMGDTEKEQEKGNAEAGPSSHGNAKPLPVGKLPAPPRQHHHRPSSLSVPQSSHGSTTKTKRHAHDPSQPKPTTTPTNIHFSSLSDSARAKPLTPLQFPHLCPTLDSHILSTPGITPTLNASDLIRRSSKEIEGFGGLRISVWPEVVAIPPVEGLTEIGVGLDLKGRVNLTTITPGMILHQNSLPFLRLLEKIRVKIMVRRNKIKIGYAPLAHRRYNVSALTALALLMKAHGCLPALSKVVSASPGLVCMDIRYYSLGQALGTYGARYILSCIFRGLQEGEWLPNQIELLSAATDLYYSRLDREDHYQLIREGDTTNLYGKFHGLFDLRDLDGLEDIVTYARFAAAREGVSFGAMRTFARDVDRHNDQTQAVVTMFANALIGVGQTTLIHTLPIGGSVASSILGTIGTWITTGITLGYAARWKAGQVDSAISARFDLAVGSLAINRGRVTGWKGEVGKEVAEEYAQVAKCVVGYVSSRAPPDTLRVYR